MGDAVETLRKGLFDKDKAKLSAVRHPTLNYTASMSRLPFCPAA